MTIGEHIRRLRTMRGWTEEELALAITSDNYWNHYVKVDGKPTMKGPTAESVRKWEDGRILPNSDALRALAYALRSNPDSLYRYWREKRTREFNERSRLRKQCCLCQNCPYHGTAAAADTVHEKVLMPPT